jgi:hypothetical protein
MSRPAMNRTPTRRRLPLAVAVLVLAALVGGLVFLGESATAGTDTDGDGFDDAVETFIGTDPLQPCSRTAAANDEELDAWPPDFNDDQKVSVVDVAMMRSAYGSTSSNNKRYDLNANGIVNISDVVLIRAAYGASCQAQPVPSNVFLGQYYDNANFTSPTFTRQDAAINFNWGTGSPHSSMGSNTFSVRWTGSFNFNAANYQFSATVDDGIRIWVDGVLKLDAWREQAATTYTFQQSMTAGSHTILVEYYENTGSAVAQVSWSQVAAPTPTPTPAPTPTPSATPGPVPVAGSRIPWQGGNWYLHGANVPWYNYGCDFGCNQNGGVSSSSVQTALRQGFSRMRDAGMHVARWWVFPGGPWQITTNSSGVPTGINPAVYADFDAALALAEEYDLYYVFTLFGSPTELESAWLNNASQRQALANALGQLFARYANNPRVLTWQIYNEPEWHIWNGNVQEGPVVETARVITQSIHANSNAYASVGSAMLDGLGMWTGIGLDYYTAHWYDYMSSGDWCAMCTDYATVKARYGLDKPLVIGEWYSDSGSAASQRFQAWYNKGYAGAFPWSLFSSRTYDGMQIDMNAATTFANQHNDIGP